MMKFEDAYRKILEAGEEIEQVANCEYLWEIEERGLLLTEEEVIAYAEKLKF